MAPLDASSVPNRSSGLWRDPRATPAGRTLRSGWTHPTALVLTGVAYLIALVAMLVLILIASPPAELTGNVGALRDSFTAYRLGFIAASLIAPSLVATLVLLLATRGFESITVRDVLGVVFLVAYIPLSSIAYTTQFTLLPRLLERDEAQAAHWYFHDVNSIPYTLDLLGYTVFGIAAVLLSAGFIAARGLWRWAGAVLLASGAASIVAFASYAGGAGSVASVLTILSAALTVPLVAIAVVIGRRSITSR